MHPGLTRDQALQDADRARGRAKRLADTEPIYEFGISADGEQVAFTTRRTAFPLGSPAFISAPAPEPGLSELFDADLHDATLTRVTQGYEGGSSEQPHDPREPKKKTPTAARNARRVRSRRRSRADGTLLAFSSTASNLVFGDGNTPPAGPLDGSDAFIVAAARCSAPCPRPQYVSPAPADRHRTRVAARRDRALAPRRQRAAVCRAFPAAVRCARLPAAGCSSPRARRAAARGALAGTPARAVARSPGARRARIASRTVAKAGTAVLAGGGELVALVLRLGKTYATLASRKGGLLGDRERRLHRRRAPPPSSHDRSDVRADGASRALARPQGPRLGGRRTDDRQAAARVLVACTGDRRAALALAAGARRGRRSATLALGTADPGRIARGRSGSGSIGDIEFWAPNRGLLDHLRRPADDRTRSVGLRRRRMASAGERLRRHRRSHRVGRAGGILDRLRRTSRTDQRIRRTLRRTGRAARRQHAVPLRRRRGGRLLRASRLRGRLLPGDARCGLPGARPSAGSPATRCQNRRSAPSTCTGTAPRWKPSRTPAKAMRSRTCARSKAVSSRACGWPRSDRVAVEEAASAGRCTASIPPAWLPTFEAEDEGGEGLPLYGPTELARGLDYLHLSAADGVLWGAASRKFVETEEPEHKPGQVTLAVREGERGRRCSARPHPLGPILPSRTRRRRRTVQAGHRRTRRSAGTRWSRPWPPSRAPAAPGSV